MRERRKEGKDGREESKEGREREGMDVIKRRK